MAWLDGGLCCRLDRFRTLASPGSFAVDDQIFAISAASRREPGRILEVHAPKRGATGPESVGRFRRGPEDDVAIRWPADCEQATTGGCRNSSRDRHVQS